MKQKRLTRFIFLVLFAITAFHLSGIEAAFCEDGLIPGESASHGCSICQPGNHSANVERAVIAFTANKGSFFSLENFTFQIKEPARIIFRPPIFI